MHTLAITGATGFLGRHLVSECLSQRRFALRLLTRNRSAVGVSVAGSAAIWEGNLLELRSLDGFLTRGCTLIHLAYMKGDGPSNVDATRNLIETAQRAGVKRVVHCSTAVVVGGNRSGVITEEAKPDPRNEYQRTKLRVEEMLLSELAPHIELAILRPTEIIGPGGEGLVDMVKRLRDAASYKKSIYHYALRNRKFNYVSVHNVVAALILLATYPNSQCGDIYHVSDDDDGNNYYAAVEKIVCSNLNRESEYAFDVGIPMPLLACLFKLMPNSSSPDRVYSCDKIASLGYRRVVGLEAAISEVVSTQCVGE